MNKISTITINGFDVDLTYNNKQLAYAFEYEGERYGNATKLASKDIMTIASTVAVLLTNAIETRKELMKDKNEN